MSDNVVNIISSYDALRMVLLFEYEENADGEPQNRNYNITITVHDQPEQYTIIRGNLEGGQFSAREVAIIRIPRIIIDRPIEDDEESADDGSEYDNDEYEEMILLEDFAVVMWLLDHMQWLIDNIVQDGIRGLLLLIYHLMMLYIIFFLGNYVFQ